MLTGPFSLESRPRPACPETARGCPAPQCWVPQEREQLSHGTFYRLHGVAGRTHLILENLLSRPCRRPPACCLLWAELLNSVTAMSSPLPPSSSVLSVLFLLSQSHIPDLFLSHWDGPALCIPLLTRLECYLMNLFSHYSVNDDSCSSARRPPGEDGFNQQIMEIKVSSPKEWMHG